MRSDIKLAVAAFVVVSAAALAFFLLGTASYSEARIYVEADKEVYHSGESMVVSLALPAKPGNMTVSVFGINDSRGSYRVQQNYSVESGMESVNLTFALPSCYGCAGVAPGEYEIYAELYSEGSLVDNSSVRISLEK
jgi:hypothetical protein